MKRGIIDRFEGQYAVIEFGRVCMNVEKVLLPANAEVGDSVTLKNDVYKLDKEATKQREKEIQALMDDVFE